MAPVTNHTGDGKKPIIILGTSKEEADPTGDIFCKNFKFFLVTCGRQFGVGCLSV